MNTYYTGGLPQGASIVTETNDQNTYVSNASSILCFPWSVSANKRQLIIDMADTTPWQSAFTAGLRAWPSIEPVGQSITASPLQSQSSVILQLAGMSWGFWNIDLNGQLLLPATISRWATPGQTYWMNVQNEKNYYGRFFCRFTYTA